MGKVCAEEYIPRVEALSVAKTFLEGDTSYSIRRRLSQIPAANVRPVVQASWVWDGDPFDERWNRKYQCSNCGKYALKDDEGVQELSDYCPNCGANMVAENG